MYLDAKLKNINLKRFEKDINSHPRNNSKNSYQESSPHLTGKKFKFIFFLTGQNQKKTGRTVFSQ